MPAPTCDTSFPTCRSSPATTSGYAKPPTSCAGSPRILAVSTSIWSDDVWVVDSTPVECGRSRETVKGSDLAGWAQYGYCASRSRFFWGLRLHLVCPLHGLPIAFALTGAKADERETCPCSRLA
ncbi:transposase [Streptosporangium canum]